MPQVMHLNVIQNVPVLSFKDISGKLSFAGVEDFFHKALSTIVDKHSDWPDDAVFMIKYRNKTWPTGWDKDATRVYFKSENDMNLWLLDKMHWTYSDDNAFCGTVHKWDFGPQYLRTVEY